MEVISIIGAKGGLGKTCLAVNLANYLSECGIETLLVDCDFNTNGSTNFMEFNGLEVNTQSTYKSLEVLISRPLGNEFDLELQKPEAKIKDCFHFVPTTIKGDEETISQFKEEDLNKQYLQMVKVFEQWRLKYDVIILDHAGGYTDLVNFLLLFTSKTLLINTNTRSGIKASRSLYKKIANNNREVIQCINRIDAKSNKEGEAIIKKCYGFEEKSIYNDALSRGDFLPLDLENMEVLKQILIALLPAFSYDIAYPYDEEIRHMQQLHNEEVKAEQTLREKRYKLAIGGCLLISIFFSAIFTWVVNKHVLPSLNVKANTAITIAAFVAILLSILGVIFLAVSVDKKTFQNVCSWYFEVLVKIFTLPLKRFGEEMDSGLRRFGEEIDRTLHRFRLHKRHRSSEEDQSTGDKVFDNFEYSAEEDDED